MAAKKKAIELFSEDTRKQSRKAEGTASARTVSRQFNKDQNITVFGKKIPNGVVSRSPKMRPKRYNESEPEWMFNTIKEDITKGAKMVKKKLYGK